MPRRATPSPKESAKPITQDVYKTMITVRVGEGATQVDFLLHKELASRSSSYFRAATQGQWVEAETGVINLPDDSPEVFMGFQTWLYTRYFRLIEFDKNGCQTKNSHISSSTRSEEKEGDDLDEDEVKGRFLVDSYVFGDKMNALNFQDQVMNAFSEYVLGNAILPSGDLVNRIYSNTPPASPLRRFIVDVTPHLDSCFSKSDDDPKEYLEDLLEAYSNFYSCKPRKSKALLDRTMHSYHTDVHTMPFTRSKKRKSR